MQPSFSGFLGIQRVEAGSVGTWHRAPKTSYPDRPDLRKHHKPLPDNWLLSTNINNRLKKNLVQAAAEVAGLKFGKDIVIEF